MIEISKELEDHKERITPIVARTRRKRKLDIISTILAVIFGSAILIKTIHHLIN